MSLEYMVIYGAVQELEGKVRLAIDEGWRPQGGVSLHSDFDAQAMVRGVENE